MIITAPLIRSAIAVALEKHRREIELNADSATKIRPREKLKHRYNVVEPSAPSKKAKKLVSQTGEDDAALSDTEPSSCPKKAKSLVSRTGKDDAELVNKKQEGEEPRRDLEK